MQSNTKHRYKDFKYNSWQKAAGITLAVFLVFTFMQPVSASRVESQAGYDGSVAVISLGFDHEFDEQYGAANLMLRNGLTGTFYVLVGQIGRDGFMTSEQLRSLQSEGFEIASHSINHIMISEDTPQDVLFSEIVESKQILESMGFVVNGYIPAQSQHTSASLDLVASHYAYTAVSFPHCQNTFPIKNENGIKVICGQSVGIGYDLYDNNVFKEIDNAIANKSYLILHFHEIDSSGEAGTTAPALFKQIITYIKSKVNAGQLQVMNQATALGLNA